MKRSLLALSILVWAFLTGYSQITDQFFEQVTYIGALGKTDWTDGWSNYTPNSANYPAPTIVIGDGQHVPGVPANEITTNTHWSSSNSPLMGVASFTNPNLANSFFEQVNFIGAFGTVDWTQGWANYDPQNAVYPATTVTIPAGHITSNQTWGPPNTYKLNGWVYIDAGATLTIQPGTVIRGDYTNQGALIIERGGKLNAIGTVSQPIVFTSNQPIGSRTYGDWGGVILCGYAQINQPGGTAVIEGGVGSIYGGGLNPNNADNSGTLKYVRIEFCGIAFAANNEINGLTMGGIGTGTTIDYIQVSYSGDDSYEWFGGTVNAKHLIAFRGLDDDFDTDNGFLGKIQFAVALRDPNAADVSGSNGFESDNDATGSSNTPITHPIFCNVSIFGPLVTQSTPYNAYYKRALHLRRNTMCSIYNSVFAGYPVGLYIDGNNTQANAIANNLQIENTLIVGCQDASKFFNVPSGQTWTAADEAAWFLSTSPNRYNDTLINNSQMLLIDPFNLTTPNFLPIKTVYKLNGWIYVKNNATLTIDPGTIIRGDKIAQGALIIERGSKLNAIGTQTEPIVFTSGEPAGSRTYGDWGGLILCGYAQINQPGGTAIIEGGVGSIYGGGLTPNNADNSGTLKYVRLEFPGIAFSPNNEINGLTMGGVGTGTTVDHIQVSYSGDDSYEWFGGTANAKYLIAFRGQDDEWDTDNGYIGKVQFAVSLRDPNWADVSGSNGFESDNDNTGSTNQPFTKPTFSNISFFGPQPTPGAACNTNYKRAMHLRRNTSLNVYNSIFLGYPTGLYIDGNNTQNKASFDSLTVQYSLLAGMPATSFFGVPGGQTWTVATERAWYLTPARHNDTLVTSVAVGITDPFNLTSPNFLPLTTSYVWGKSYWSRNVTGQITYDNAANTPMSNTTVYLKTQAGAIVESTTTNVSGNYTIYAVNGIYVLDGSTTKTYGGLDAVDAVRIRQNVSNIYPFTPLQYKAANVDLTTGPNNGVNVVDAVQIRQKLANIPTPNWKIANYVFETPTITVAGSGVVQNFKSLCAGDVNKSWTPPVE